jgi:tetratricopeptide (TPR) repeat protein
MLLVASYSSDARAESTRVERLLTSAEDSFLDVEYEDALGSLQSADALGEASEAQTERILALRGTIYLLMEDEAQARSNFERLLSMDASYQLPEAYTPRAQAFLERMRDEAAAVAAIAISHEPPQRFEPGERLIITAEIRGFREGYAVSVFHRLFGGHSYSSTEMTRVQGDTFSGEIPLDGELASGAGGIVEYFLVVTDGESRVANEGSPRNPLSFEVVGSEGRRRGGGGTSVARRWWFWTILGVAVAAGLGFGLGFGLAGEEQVPTGDVSITLTFQDE